MSEIRLGSPLRGWAMRLEEVPDPVFAERMMGDGIAIDPLEGLVVAPAQGRITSVAPTGHAVTLELANGAHLLIHIGLETVALGGAGFAPCVAEGDRVQTGDALLRFDMDLVARQAKSLVTPIVLVDAGFRLRREALDRVVRSGETLLTVIGQVDEDRPASEGPRAARRVAVKLRHGLHARPAARIVEKLKGLSARVELASGERKADGRSLVALLALGLRHGEEIELSATGADAEQALADIAALLEDDAAEPEPELPSIPPAGATVRAGAIAGVTAAPGLAVAPIAQFRPPPIEVPVDGQGLAVEQGELRSAIARVAAELRMSGDQGTGIAAAHLAILEDPQLAEAAQSAIAAGRSAGHGWQQAIAGAARRIEATGDPLLVQRVSDLRDVERRVLAHLVGLDGKAIPDVPPGALLIAEDLLPSQFLGLGTDLAGIVTARGGATSHVSILAASAGVPMLIAAGAAVLDIPDGREAILDASAGWLDPAPDSDALAAARQLLSARAENRAAAAARAAEDCRTADGTRIEIFANLASAAEAVRAVEAGAEGCGLLRTEFLFLDRADAPGEDEQARAYAAVAGALAGRPLIVRTLDIGADKPVPYLALPREENPALGQRGIRLGLAHPELLRSQLRAIVKGVPPEQCRIMLPMVSELGELRAVRAVLAEVLADLGRSDGVELGVMIETPAAALLADEIAAEADFLSVGTNDLTQYALACDRMNAATARQADALHPAVLRLIRLAAEGADRHGRCLGVCGGLASDPDAAAILIGLGVRELSVSPAAIAELKAAVRGLRVDPCRALADAALGCASAREVRTLLAASGEPLKGAA